MHPYSAVQLDGYKDAPDAPAPSAEAELDYKSLSYHATLRGAVSLQGSKGMPSLPNVTASAAINYHWNAGESRLGDVALNVSVAVQHRPDPAAPPVVDLRGSAQLKW